jgi:glycosyltransferase involved in cell wall biosynthesis
MAHLNFLVLLLRPLFPKETRVLVRQNATVSATLAFGGLPWFTRPLYWLLYPRADLVICQTRAMAKDLTLELGVTQNRLTVLPNPVNFGEIRQRMEQSQSQWTGPGPHLIAVGRLSPEKGFDLLLKSFVQVRREFPRAGLVILGTGPEEFALKAECSALGLDHAVRFPGYVAEPWIYFKDATAFVLSSRHEGLPNALLEAAAAELPIVALPAARGVVELLDAQPGVWLANEISEEALTASLLTALRALRSGERFAHTFIDTYEIDSAICAYEAIIDATLTTSTKHERTNL